MAKMGMRGRCERAAAPPYNGRMTFTDPSLGPQLSVADVFLGHLAGAATSTSSPCCSNRTSRSSPCCPKGCASGRVRSASVAAFAMWFGGVDEYELVDAAAGHLGPRLHLRWRARVRGGPFGDSSFVVEQHVYADRGPTGRIERDVAALLRLRPERGDG